MHSHREILPFYKRRADMFCIGIAGAFPLLWRLFLGLRHFLLTDCDAFSHALRRCASRHSSTTPIDAAPVSAVHAALRLRVRQSSRHTERNNHQHCPQHVALPRSAKKLWHKQTHLVPPTPLALLI
jgi:hypothetical protein